MFKRFFSISPWSRGLEEFFESNQAWVWREKEGEAGRPWTCAYLRLKSFDDLHKLWWICIKEQNKLESQKVEANRFRIIFPFKNRLFDLKRSMSRIKRVLWERKIAYDQALYLVDRETKRLQLEKAGSSSMEINDLLSVEFPLDLDKVGRNRKKFKLQDRYKGVYKHDQVEKENSQKRWFIE